MAKREGEPIVSESKTFAEQMQAVECPVLARKYAAMPAAMPIAVSADARVAELEANHQKYRAVVEGEFVDYERQIAELKAERDRLREALGGELPTAPFGDILGHNYWMDVNTLRRLWRRMAAAALAAKEVGRG